MKIWCLLLLASVFACSTVLADAGLEIEKISKEDVVVAEIGNPAYYDLVINNLEDEDQFRIFTLVGVQIEPSEYVTLESGETTVPIKATMSEKILRERRGLLYFEYQIKGMNRDLLKDKLLVKIVSMKDILEVKYGDLNPDNNLVEISMSNKEDVKLENLTLIFESVFFRESTPLSLGPYENKTFSVLVNRDGIESLVAGPYITMTTVVAGDEEIKLEGVVDFLEKEGTSVSESKEGIIIRTATVTKTNKGNTPVTASVTMKKDILSRLFTTYSAEPIQTTRDGFFVEYVWQEDLNPNEEFVVRATTNYTVPFLILILIVVVGIVARIYYLGVVSINKRVSLVRTRGGEFALRVVLRVRARKTVDKLQLHDSLPGMTKLYEKFGKQPDMIEKDSRRLVWNIGHLRRGEERVYSYVIYSKLNVVGRFELPLAHASFEKDGKHGEVYSNRAYFAMEKS
jgi:hypothetical protein